MFSSMKEQSFFFTRPKQFETAFSEPKSPIMNEEKNEIKVNLVKTIISLYLSSNPQHVTFGSVSIVVQLL